MKNLMTASGKFFSLTLLAIVFVFSASAQKKLASPKATAEGTIEGVSVNIVYHSPGVKGRKIFGGLEKWGKVWRAGANNATTIEFSEDVKINGQDLSKGKYAFFIIPKENDDWTIIFNKVADQWGAYKYDESEDALRVDITPKEVQLEERLKYTIDEENGVVAMTWAETSVPFNVSKQ